MDAVAVKSLLRALISGFLLNGVNAIIGLAKMGIVSHSINPKLLTNYFLDLAIWGWFAINGESVRQSSRQSITTFSWKSGLISIKQEWKILLPFTIFIIVSTQLTSLFNVRLSLTEILITIMSGWCFVYTSTYTGMLEAKGKVELANWVTLGSSVLTLPLFFLVSTHVGFDFLLGFYFLLNLIYGFLHLVVLSILSNLMIENSLVSKSSDVLEFKKVLLFESLPRVLIPFLIANISNEQELYLYSVLIRIFLIYGIFAVSINPIVALKGRIFSANIVDKVLRILGPFIFIFSSICIILFSKDLIVLVGATNIVPSIWDYFSFTLLGGVSILTQPFIGSVTSGKLLNLRSKSALLANIAIFILLPILVKFWDSIGGFYALSLFQIIYFALLKKSLSKPRSFLTIKCIPSSIANLFK